MSVCTGGWRPGVTGCPLDPQLASVFPDIVQLDGGQDCTQLGLQSGRESLQSITSSRLKEHILKLLTAKVVYSSLSVTKVPTS